MTRKRPERTCVVCIVEPTLDKFDFVLGNFSVYPVMFSQSVVPTSPMMGHHRKNENDFSGFLCRVAGVSLSDEVRNLVIQERLGHLGGDLRAARGPGAEFMSPHT